MARAPASHRIGDTPTTRFDYTASLVFRQRGTDALLKGIVEGASQINDVFSGRVNDAVKKASSDYELDIKKWYNSNVGFAEEGFVSEFQLKSEEFRQNHFDSLPNDRARTLFDSISKNTHNNLLLNASKVERNVISVNAIRDIQLEIKKARQIVNESKGDEIQTAIFQEQHINDYIDTKYANKEISKDTLYKAKDNLKIFRRDVLEELSYSDPTVAIEFADMSKSLLEPREYNKIVATANRQMNSINSDYRKSVIEKSETILEQVEFSGDDNIRLDKESLAEQYSSVFDKSVKKYKKEEFLRKLDEANNIYDYRQKLPDFTSNELSIFESQVKAAREQGQYSPDFTDRVLKLISEERDLRKENPVKALNRRRDVQEILSNYVDAAKVIANSDLPEDEKIRKQLEVKKPYIDKIINIQQKEGIPESDIAVLTKEQAEKMIFSFNEGSSVEEQIKGFQELFWAVGQEHISKAVNQVSKLSGAYKPSISFEFLMDSSETDDSKGWVTTPYAVKVMQIASQPPPEMLDNAIKKDIDREVVAQISDFISAYQNETGDYDRGNLYTELVSKVAYQNYVSSGKVKEAVKKAKAFVIDSNWSVVNTEASFGSKDYSLRLYNRYKRSDGSLEELNQTKKEGIAELINNFPDITQYVDDSLARDRLTERLPVLKEEDRDFNDYLFDERQGLVNNAKWVSDGENITLMYTSGGLPVKPVTLVNGKELKLKTSSLLYIVEQASEAKELLKKQNEIYRNQMQQFQQGLIEEPPKKSGRVSAFELVKGGEGSVEYSDTIRELIFKELGL